MRKCRHPKSMRFAVHVDNRQYGTTTKPYSVPVVFWCKRCGALKKVGETRWRYPDTPTEGE